MKYLIKDGLKYQTLAPEAMPDRASDCEMEQATQLAKYDALIEEVIKLNLTIPVDLCSIINKQMNKVEAELKKLGINPRSIK